MHRVCWEVAYGLLIYVVECVLYMAYMYHCTAIGAWVRGLVNLKKYQKSEKNSQVGEWVKPQLGLFFFWNSVFLCVVFMFLKKKLDGGGGWSCGVWPIRVFLGFFLTWKDPLAKY